MPFCYYYGISLQQIYYHNIEFETGKVEAFPFLHITQYFTRNPIKGRKPY